MPNNVSSKTDLVTVRVSRLHIRSLKALPKGESPSSLVRALLENFIDGKELPLSIRSLRPRLQQVAKAATKSSALYTTMINAIEPCPECGSLKHKSCRTVATCAGTSAQTP